MPTSSSLPPAGASRQGAGSRGPRPLWALILCSLGYQSHALTAATGPFLLAEGWLQTAMKTSWFLHRLPAPPSAAALRLDLCRTGPVLGQGLFPGPCPALWEFRALQCMVGRSRFHGYLAPWISCLLPTPRGNQCHLPFLEDAHSLSASGTVGWISASCPAALAPTPAP